MPSALISVKDSSGANVNIEKPIIPGQATMADSRPVVIASNQTAVPVTGTVAISGTPSVTGTVTVNGIPTTAEDRGAGATTANTVRVVIVNEQTEGSRYKDVAASQPSTTLNGAGAGAVGDYLAGITVVPESLNPGQITLQDGALTAVVVFFGGTASVSNLVPFWIPLGNTSLNGAWKVVTGAAVHLRASGNFT